MRAQPSVPGQRAWVVFDVVSAAVVTAWITSQVLINWHRRDWAAHAARQPGAAQVAGVVAGVLLCCAALAARRWRPLLSAAVLLAVWLGMLAAAWPLAAGVLNGFEVIGAVLLYSVAVTEPPPVAAAVLAALYGCDVATLAVTGSHHPVNNLLAAALTLALAFGLGVGVARYRDIGARLRAQQDAAARAELDRERVRWHGSCTTCWRTA